MNKNIKLPIPEFILVTPEMAAVWLASNNSNRTLRPYKVNDYIRDIQADRWTFSNDGICLAEDGRLLNGQHRLTAIIESGKAAWLLVIKEMPPEAMVAMDRGTVRTTADLLKLDGYKNHSALAAITRFIIVVDSGRVYGDNKNARATDGEIEEFIAANPIVERIASYASTVKAHIDCPPQVLGTAYWLIQQVNGTSLTEFFFDQLASRENEPTGSAVLALDSRLRSIHRDRTKIDRRDMLRLIVNAWNHYAVDSRVSMLTVTYRGSFNLPTVKKWRRGESSQKASA